MTGRRYVQSLPDDVVAWFEDLGVVEEDEYSRWVTRRADFLTYPKIRELGGLPPDTVLASLELAGERADGSLLVVGNTVGGSGCWIHLPDEYWGLAP